MTRSVRDTARRPGTRKPHRERLSMVAEGSSPTQSPSGIAGSTGSLPQKVEPSRTRRTAEASRRTPTRGREDASTAAGGRMSLVVLVMGLAGGLLLVIAEFTTIAAVDIPGRTCPEVADPRAADRCELSGFERHGGAFVLLGGLAIVMAFGAARARSRPAAVALIAIATIALALTLVRDLPETNETGALGITYEGASAEAGPGLYLEAAAGLLLAGGGALALARRR